jgi:hypothetical protein
MTFMGAAYRAIAFAALCGALFAQVPTTEGKTLSDKPVVVAEAIKGRPALLIVTFSRGAGEGAMGWMRSLQATGNLSRLAVYQIAALENVPRLFRRVAISGMRKAVPPVRHHLFVILTSDTQAWKDLVNFADEGDPYLVVIDSSGSVKHKIAGEMTEARMQQLAQTLKALK